MAVERKMDCTLLVPDVVIVVDTADIVSPWRKCEFVGLSHWIG